jgi:hypothetical protein
VAALRQLLRDFGRAVVRGRHDALVVVRLPEGALPGGPSDPFEPFAGQLLLADPDQAERDFRGPGAKGAIVLMVGAETTDRRVSIVWRVP